MSKRSRVGLVMALVLVTGQAFTQDQQDGQVDHLPALRRRFNSLPGITQRFGFADSIYNADLESDLNTASWFAAQLYAMADSIGTAKARILGNHAMSMVLAYRGDYSGSLPYCQRELELGVAASDTLTVVRAYLNMGDNYIDLGRLNLAYLFTQKALETATRSRSEVDIEFATHNLGRIYKELGRYDLAFKMFQSSDSMSRRLQDPQGPLYSQWELGDLHFRRKEYDLAERNLLSALALTRVLSLGAIRPSICIDLARLNVARSRFEVARAYFDTARSIGARLGNRFIESESLLGYGTIQLSQGDWKSARETLLQAIRVAQEWQSRTVEMECYQKLAEGAEREGAFEAALGYHRRHEQLEDSLLSRDIPYQNLQYQMEFLGDSKDSELARHREQLDQQHVYRNLLLAGLSVFGVLLYLLYRAVQRRNQVNGLLVAQQKELESRSRKLEDLNRLKDKFLSIISHDLRSPINTLAGVLNLMEKNGVSPQELPMLTRELRIQFNHTRNLITNLLNWALLQMDRITIRKESLALSPVVEENFRLVRSLTGKNIDLVNTVSPEIRVTADPNSLDLILRNLIQNAVKFTDPGGTVMVAAQEESDAVTVRVQDNGVGIPPDVQQMLLSGQSGYTSLGTANEKGTGLGLGLCKEFVERNGGKIWLTSQPDEGTTFYFTLPKSVVAG